MYTINDCYTTLALLPLLLARLLLVQVVAAIGAVLVLGELFPVIDWAFYEDSHVASAF